MPCWPLFVSRVVVFLVLSLILCSFMHFSIFHSRSWFDLLSCNYYPKCIIIRWQTPFSPTIQSSHPPGIFNQICPSIPGTFSQACGLFRHFPYLDYSGNLLPFCFVNLLVWAGHAQPVTLWWVRCTRSLFLSTLTEFLNYHFLSEICLEIFIKVSWRWPYPYWLALLFGSSNRFLKGVPNLRTKVRKDRSKSNQIPFHVIANIILIYQHKSYLDHFRYGAAASEPDISQKGWHKT